MQVHPLVTFDIFDRGANGGICFEDMLVVEGSKPFC
jgi:hypothetical protein